MKKNRILICLVAILCLTFLWAVCAAADGSGDIGNGLTWSLTSGKLTISKTGEGTGEMQYFNESGDGAPPWKRSEITSVVINNGVTNVGSFAFKGCAKLTSLELPGTITSIGWNAFAGCGKLKTINLPQGLKTIQSYAFSECDSLEEVVLPASATNLDNSVFYNCDRLRKVTLPSTLEIIPDSCFFQCAALTDVNIPATVTAIKSNAFSGCKSLTSIVFPAGITTIENWAYAGTGIKSVRIPEGIESIKDFAFSGCEQLTCVILPSSIDTIADGAFSGCPLTDVFYPKANREGIIMVNSNAELTNAFWHYGETAPAKTAVSDIWDISYEFKVKKTDQWGNPQFAVTGTATCKQNPAHQIVEETNAWYQNDPVWPTCTEKGKYDLCCSGGDFKFRGFSDYEQKGFEVPALGHAYKVDKDYQPTYAWSLDNTKAYASLNCWRCCRDEYKKIEEVSTTVTSSGAGKKVYTAEFKDPMFETQTKEVVSGRDITPPQLKKVTIDTKSVSKPGILQVTLEFEEEETGLKSWDIQAIADGTNNWEFLGSEYYSTPKYTGSIKAMCQISDTFKTGTHLICSISLTDSQGNNVNYQLESDRSTSELVVRDSATWAIVGRVPINNGFEVNEDIDSDFQLHVSNPKLTDRITELPDGGHGVVTYDGENLTARAELFDALKGKNASITFSNNEIQWVFNGKDINNASKDINLQCNSWTAPGADYGTTDDVLVIQFADNGVLPGKATIRIKSDYYFKINNLSHAAYLYFVDNGGSLITQQSGVTSVLDQGDHWCEFYVTHNSTYIIAQNMIDGAKEEQQGTQEAQEGQETPEAQEAQGENQEQTTVETDISKVNVIVKDQTYTGKKLKPALTVTLGGKELVLDTDYTVKWKNNKNIGKATVTLKGKGSYTGEKKVTFKINPKGVKLSKLKGEKKGLTVKWKKGASNIDGYEIQYSLKEDFSSKKTVKVNGRNETEEEIKKLKKKKTYYVRIRTWTKVSGKKYYSEWSKVKSVKTK